MSDSNGTGTLPPELIDEATDILDDMREWRLTPEQWAEVDLLVQRGLVAAEAGDARALDAVVADLELFGPPRAKSADKGAKTGQSANNRDATDRLRDSLKPPPKSGQGKSSGGSGKGR
jgi:hypothetical protein